MKTICIALLTVGLAWANPPSVPHHHPHKPPNITINVPSSRPHVPNSDVVYPDIRQPGGASIDRCPFGWELYKNDFGYYRCRPAAHNTAASPFGEPKGKWRPIIPSTIVVVTVPAQPGVDRTVDRNLRNDDGTSVPLCPLHWHNEKNPLGKYECKPDFR